MISARTFFLAGGITWGLAILIAGIYVIRQTGGGPDETARVAVTPTATASATATPRPEASSTQPAAATATAPALASASANRMNCAQIRGTDYLSDAEQLWFQQNCSPTPTPTTAVSAAGTTAAACPITEQQLRAQGGSDVAGGQIEVPQAGYVYGLFYVRGPDGCFRVAPVTVVCQDGTRGPYPNTIAAQDFCAPRGGVLRFESA